MKKRPMTCAQAGRKGGKVKSEAKTMAVRENGKKGGRPKKKTGKELKDEIQKYFYQSNMKMLRSSMKSCLAKAKAAAVTSKTETQL